jgi:hypothetical protein
MRPPQRPAPRAAAAGLGLARMQARQQRAARLGRQPVDAGARGEAKDVQEVVFYTWRRRRHLKVLPPLRQRMVDFRERHLSTWGTPPAIA